MRSFRLLALLAPVAFTACLSGSETISGNNGTPIDCATLATDLSGAEPTLTTTASGLKYRDQTAGTGAMVSVGNTVRVRYSGCLTTGVKFDEQNDATPGYQFVVGDSVAAIAGFNEGMVGMKVGGRRQLVIPPALGYGSRANGAIPPNSILVFTVDLVAAQ